MIVTKILLYVTNLRPTLCELQLFPKKRKKRKWKSYHHLHKLLRNSSKIFTDAAILSLVIINLFCFKHTNRDTSNLLCYFLDIPQTLQKYCCECTKSSVNFAPTLIVAISILCISSWCKTCVHLRVPSS